MNGYHFLTVSVCAIMTVALAYFGFEALVCVAVLGTIGVALNA